MDKVLKVLSEIEDKANRIMANANEYKKTLDQEKDKSLAKIDEESRANLDKKISKLKSQFNDEISTINEKVNKDSEKQLALLNEKYVSNLDSIANSIFKKIIEV